MPHDIEIDDDAIEVSDEEAREIQEAARHEQVLESFEILTKAVVKGSDNKEIEMLIKKHSKELATLVETIKENQPTIEVDQSEIITLLKEVVVSNNKLTSALENRLLPTTFTFARDYNQMAESVNVNYTPANLIKLKN